MASVSRPERLETDRDDRVGADGVAPGIDPLTERLIGDQLRSAFAKVISEPIPQRLIDLLDRLVKESET